MCALLNRGRRCEAPPAHTTHQHVLRRGGHAGVWCVRERLPLLLFGDGEAAGQTTVAARRRRDLVEDATQDLPKQLIACEFRRQTRIYTRPGRDGLGHSKAFRGKRGERLR